VELGLTAASLASGWLASLAVTGASVVAFTSLASGRLQWDLPRTLWTAVRDPVGDTAGARLFAGQSAGIMAGGLLFSLLVSAFFSGAAATALGLLSLDWETSMAPVVASGLLAAGVVGIFAGSAFVTSLLVPVPLVWLLAFGGAAALGIVVTPVAAVVGQLLSKRARAIPGGLISAFLQALPLNPLTRPTPQ
jgi:hypothetical protein